MTINRIVTLAEKTNDAYSFNRYINWRACVAMLCNHGLDDRQIEAVLRSKWTRWASDASNKSYGRATSKDLERWITAGNMWDREVEKLTAEHFGEDMATTIAQRHLGINTLQTRNRDQLDFHSVSVWAVRSALEAAYKLGKEEGTKKDDLTVKPWQRAPSV